MQIEIKSRPVGLLFGYSAYRTIMNGFFKMKGKYMSEEGNFTDFGLAKMIHAGHENYCLAKDMPTNVEFDDVLEWIDTVGVTDSGKVILADIVNAWSASTHMKKLVEETEKKSQEKTLSSPTSTQSNPSATESLVLSPGSLLDIPSEKSTSLSTDSVSGTE